MRYSATSFDFAVEESGIYAELEVYPEDQHILRVEVVPASQPGILKRDKGPYFVMMLETNE